MASSPHMEVVEDSEPEREELRRKLKEDRRRRRDANTKENHITAPSSTVATFQLSKSNPVCSGVIDISDDDSKRFINGVHPLTEVPNAPLRQDEGTQSTSPPVEREEPLAEDQTESGFKPRVLSNLNRFAFVAKLSNPPSRMSHSLSRTPSTDSAKQYQPPPQPRSTKSTEPASKGWDFSDSEFSRLLKCISCDVKWTVRKSATQKLAHIKTCARKTHLSDETVKTLIQREITASSLPVAAGTSKGREKEKRKVKDQASVDAPPETFLEHVVLEDSAGQKKRRRKHGPETVQSVSETRGTILEKAKLLLQTAPLLPEIDSALEPPMTQAFGESNLGQNAFGAGTSSSRWNIVTGRNPGNTEYNECPPATQAFGTSRLGTTMKQSSAHLSRQNSPAPSIDYVSPQTALSSAECARKDCRDDVIGIFSHPPQSNVFPNSNCDESSSRHKVTNGPHDNQEHHEHQDFFEIDNEHPWEEDDAVIHFDPGDYISIGNLDSERFSPTESFNIIKVRDNEAGIHNGRRRSLSNVSSSHSEINEVGRQPGKKITYNHSETFIATRCSTVSPEHSQKTRRPPSAKSRHQKNTKSPSHDEHGSNDADIVPPNIVPKSIRQRSLKHQNKSRSKKRVAVGASQDHSAADIAAAEEEGDDHELSAVLKKMVLDDETLHLRILHYEPIHFDVFMKMAEERSIKSKSLKLKMRTFLDQQAISFYGYYAGRRARR